MQASRDAGGLQSLLFLFPTTGIISYRYKIKEIGKKILSCDENSGFTLLTLMCNACAKLLSCVQLFVTLWTVAHQFPLSMEFSRQEYWSGLPFPSPGDLPDPGIEPTSALVDDYY